MKKFLRHLFLFCSLAGGCGAFLLGLLLVTSASVSAHSGAPALTTFGTGQTLTSQALNDSFAHIHNTLSGGILNVNISTSAGIAHSKLATPALVPKAWALVAGVCTCNDAADTTTCTLTASSRVTSIKSSGTAGICRVTLAYTPTNVGFAIVGSAHTAANMFISTSQATSAPHFLVQIVSDVGAATNAPFSFVVMDDNN
jgi:hypothetical protein